MNNLNNIKNYISIANGDAEKADVEESEQSIC